MVQGGGSAMFVTLILALLLLHSQQAQAATYVVGGSSGWTFNVNAWPNGMAFKAGDILVFNYSPSAHNVVAVSRTDYSGCRTSRGSKVYKTGKDRIRLARGSNYFICSFQGHCQSGMKIAVTAK